jgi:transcriptional regulator with XRE-family HTH domain
MSLAESENAEHLRATLGAILRRHREAKERSLAEVAQPAGISGAFLSEVERGRKDVSSERLLRICRALEVSVGDLYLELARELGAREQQMVWAVAEDPRVALQRASRVLDSDSLRSVAQFSAYLALIQDRPEPPRRPIGFQR